MRSVEWHLPVAVNSNELTCVIISHLSAQIIPLKAHTLLTYTSMSHKSGMITGSRTRLLPAELLMGWIPIIPLSSGHLFSESGKRISDLNPFFPERLSTSQEPVRCLSPATLSLRLVPFSPWEGRVYTVVSFVPLLPEDGEWAEQCLFVFQLYNGRCASLVK